MAKTPESIYVRVEVDQEKIDTLRNAMAEAKKAAAELTERVHQVQEALYKLQGDAFVGKNDDHQDDRRNSDGQVS